MGLQQRQKGAAESVLLCLRRDKVYGKTSPVPVIKCTRRRTLCQWKRSEAPLSIRNVLVALVALALLLAITIASSMGNLRLEYAAIGGTVVLALWALVIACDERCGTVRRRHYIDIVSNQVKKRRCEPQQETA
ncbi:hypothetical protein MTO96_017834 [Rhipicephalus appendiculatus]